jgi:hypothetical protein
MSQRKMFLTVAILVLSICTSSYAAWTEPIHLSELNNGNIIADFPTVSNDGSVIFYIRDISLPSFYQWESRLNPETGMYENERRVSELGPRNGDYVYIGWISNDMKRYYYSFAPIDWGRRIHMAVKNDSTGLLQEQTYFSELQVTDIVIWPSLTSDELNIMFGVGAKGTGSTKVYTASRSCANEQFGNIREATEFAKIGSDHSFLTLQISGDGLTVYFEKRNNENLFDIWKGIRESLDEPFGNFEPLSEVINMPGTKSMRPCLANDGETLYFFRGSQNMEPSLRGIYVSYWVETPYETAVRVTKEAIAEKEAIIEQLDVTIAKENEGLEALDAMIESGEYEGMSKQEVLKARKNISAGIRKQENARRMLTESLDDLRVSYSILVP